MLHTSSISFFLFHQSSKHYQQGVLLTICTYISQFFQVYTFSYKPANLIFKYQKFYSILYTLFMTNKTQIAGIASIIVCVLILTAQYSSNNTYQDSFYKWKKQYNVEIKSQDENYRRQIFRNNLHEIENHNAQKNITFKMGLNAFAHLTKEQFIAMYLEKPIQMQIKSDVDLIDPKNDDYIDWQSRGAVTPVKTQGSCTSSYAFAAVASVEGFIQILNHQIHEFSNQQVVDCSRPYGNGGCQGGTASNSLNYIKNAGLAFRANYPYHGSEGQCMNPPTHFRINSYATVNDCNSLISALHSNPISVIVDASNMQFYHSGIFTNCGTTLNYNMLLTASIDTYFRLKSSWGPQWGEGGYIQILKGNGCGVCMQGVYPTNSW